LILKRAYDDVAGVVDQNVDGSETALDIGDHAIDGVLIGKITCFGNDGGSACLKVLSCAIELFLISGADGKTGVPGGELTGEDETESAGPSGDEHGFPEEAETWRAAYCGDGSEGDA
jgi:hypothetical protein